MMISAPCSVSSDKIDSQQIFRVLCHVGNRIFSLSCCWLNLSCFALLTAKFWVILESCVHGCAHGISYIPSLLNTVMIMYILVQVQFKSLLNCVLNLTIYFPCRLVANLTPHSTLSTLSPWSQRPPRVTLDNSLVRTIMMVWMMMVWIMMVWIMMVMMLLDARWWNFGYTRYCQHVRLKSVSMSCSDHHHPRILSLTNQIVQVFKIFWCILFLWTI